MSKIEVNAIEPQCGTTLTVGASGDTITFPTGTTIVNNGTQTGFGRTGTVDWQTGSIKTATFTAANGEGYFCNTAGGTFEVDLPAGSAGAIVSVQDYNNTFDSHSLTVDPDGTEKINGGDGGASIELDTEGRGVTFVYVDATVGWRSVQDNDFIKSGSNATFITATGGTPTTSPCGNYKIHTFTGPGTFCVSAVGCACGSNSVDYMVVAGGGGGGAGPGGGGGAGGFREGFNPGSYTASPLATSALPVSVQGYTIAVGGGGPGKAAGSSGVGTNGINSTFSTIISAGGGGGGAGLQPGPGGTPAGLPGGSGGGGGNNNPGAAGGPGQGPGGTGNTPPVSPSQGNNGGYGEHDAVTTAIGAGGGGAGAAGTNGSIPPGAAGPGGNGVTTSINGSPTAFAGGGGGGAHNGDAGPAATGGTGGGGNGGTGTPNPLPKCGVNGTDNTGGGAGAGASEGAGGGSGGTGGSGIVIIRYKFQ